MPDLLYPGPLSTLTLHIHLTDTKSLLGKRHWAKCQDAAVNKVPALEQLSVVVRADSSANKDSLFTGSAEDYEDDEAGGCNEDV